MRLAPRYAVVIAIFVTSLASLGMATKDEQTLISMIPFPSYILEYDPINQPCERGFDNRRSDLCAQWKAADAAIEGAKWAMWTFFVTAGAFIAAGAAAIYAQRAAIATERTADIARATGEAQVRAYLGVEKTYIDSPAGVKGATALVRIGVRNSGNSPARISQMHSQIVSTSLENPFPDVEFEHYGKEDYQLGNNENVFLMQCPLTREHVEQYLAGKCRLFHVSLVQYRHVFSASSDEERFSICTELFPTPPGENGAANFAKFSANPIKFVGTRNWANFKAVIKQ